MLASVAAQGKQMHSFTPAANEEDGGGSSGRVLLAVELQAGAAAGCVVNLRSPGAISVATSVHAAE
jgi:hypothetical protein